MFLILTTRFQSVVATLLTVCCGLAALGETTCALGQCADCADDRIEIAQWDKTSGIKVPINIRPCDEVWLISSREFRCHECPVDRLKVWRAEGSCWQRSTLEDFLHPMEKSEMNTVLYSHGNLTDFHYAQVRGFQMYNHLTGFGEPAPVRFVIWAWPSEGGGKLRLPQTNMNKADMHAFFLARLLYRFPANEPVSLIGYSYGSRITMGALHLAGGGKIDGRGIEECGQCKLAPYRVTLIAPTLPYHCLEPCRSHDKAIDLTQRAFVIHNHCDPAMKAYWMVLKTGCVPVMGSRGIADVCRIPNGREKLKQFHAEQVAKRHSIVYYLHVRGVIANIQQTLFGE